MRLSRSLLVLLSSASFLACHSSESKPPPAPPAFTLHYHRPANDYAGWTVQLTSGAVQQSATSSRTDGFGAVYEFDVKDGASALTLGFSNGQATDTAVTIDVSGSVREASVFSGSDFVVPHALAVLPGANEVVLYYTRPDATYTGWGLHTWGERVTETQWTTPLAPAGTDATVGAAFVIPLKTGGNLGNCAPGAVCVIAHKGDTKDPGPDMQFNPAVSGNIVFLTSGSTKITSAPRKAGGVEINGAAAHLLTGDTLVWCVRHSTGNGACIRDPAATTYELRYSATAAIAAVQGDVTGGDVIALTPTDAAMSTALAAQAPHLRTWPAFTIAASDLDHVKSALKGQLVAVARDANGKALEATQVQTAFALDNLYAYDGPLGIAFASGAPTVRLWAPTAQSVKLHVANQDKSALADVAMTAGAQGVWSATGDATWAGKFYRFEVVVFHPATGKIETLTVTDPYAVSLSTNSKWAQFVDLNDPALQPAGWSSLAKPAISGPQDITLYELHVRDFSANDPTTPADRRGKFLGFVTDTNATPSKGVQHLKALAQAGLSHVHLLPAFDLASVDEDPANRIDLDDPMSKLCAKATTLASCTQAGTKTIREVLAALPGDSTEQRKIADALRPFDSFNWGYDPLHYGAPEGSYASNPDGSARVLEFRQMVKSLADDGLRLVMDVVYNHTNAAGVGDKSVLDKVVPGYYHRLDAESGLVLAGTCCADTATEHRMMQRLMVDTLVRWARDYKVDGFRFDLMGYHMKQNILDAKAALQALTVAKDGVDGSKIYLYGEGWSTDEAASRGLNASQLNMKGTGVGTFNDRIRDGVRGGGPFDSGPALRTNQGFANGRIYDRNELAPAAADDLGNALLAKDWIKLGLTGNLFLFPLRDASGVIKTGGDVLYNGTHAAYADEPAETINYVSAHDNQILFDINQYKLPTATAATERARAQALAQELTILGQGVPFLHAGDELLRSKSTDKNSYDSGDWFNRVDWSGQTNYWRTGFPMDPSSEADTTVIQQLFSDATIAPAPADIALADARTLEALQVRKSSPLFRLGNGQDVRTRVDFVGDGPTQDPAVLTMTVTDAACAGADLDPKRDAVVVVFNADKVTHTVQVAGAAGFTLHTVQLASGDPRVQQASVSGDTFTVPARTTAVFEALQGSSRGAGLPCNTKTP